MWQIRAFVLLYDSTKRASSQLKRAYVRTGIEQGESTYALKTTASDVLLIGSHLLIQGVKLFS
jgi:hypothetical protein